MPRPTNDEIRDLLHEDFDVKSGAGFISVIENHEKFLHGVAVGVIVGMVLLVAAFDVWLYGWN